MDIRILLWRETKIDVHPCLYAELNSTSNYEDMLVNRTRIVTGFASVITY